MTVTNQRPVSTTLFVPEKANHGFTMFTPLAADPGVTWLIDMHGRLVHRWELPAQVRLRSELLTGGTILTGLAHKSGYAHLPFSGGEIAEIGWDGETVWSYLDDRLDLHDWVRRDNGNLIVLKYTEVPPKIAATVQGGLPGTEEDGTMLSYVIQEITPAGKVVWEWVAHEHMDPVLDAIDPVGIRAIWPGWNAIEELPGGDLMLSSYNTSTVVIVDRATEDVRWRWGKGQISFQHNPTWLPNGNILLFDNQRFNTRWMPPDYSRLIEVDPESKEIVWEYKETNPVDFYNTYMGSAQRLPNGNTMVCEAALGGIFEITAAGERVWEYVVPFFHDSEFYGRSNAIFRAHRYQPGYPGLAGRDLSGAALSTWNELYGRQNGRMLMESR
ncbi:arylsulfotransferase family protein [Amycolatopsis jejuensis]|uniref:arylsulfotransferase family protein n=1 Tax=Amycolatopsis jejuensis TaxID=330084 RepID=UPI0006896B7F|nr:arylsulfotransferase family protein [Amycolatopsis jejuensis]